MQVFTRLQSMFMVGAGNGTGEMEARVLITQHPYTCTAL